MAAVSPNIMSKKVCQTSGWKGEKQQRLEGGTAWRDAGDDERCEQEIDKEREREN